MSGSLILLDEHVGRILERVLRERGYDAVQAKDQFGETRMTPHSSSGVWTNVPSSRPWTTCVARRSRVHATTPPIPVLAAIHYHATEGFIGTVKARDDIERFEVTDDTRDALPAELATRIRDHLSRQSRS